MIGQKLTRILQSLDPAEFRRLKRAFESPYFATNSRLLDFYAYMKRHYPEFDPKKLQKEKLFKKLYPGKPFNDGLLRVMVREFSTVVEDFIMLERLRSDKYKRRKMLVGEYGDRNLYEYFKKGTSDLLGSFDNSTVPDMEYYSECVELYQDYCFHPMTNNYDANDHSLEDLMDSLDSYFVLAKYRFTQILRNRNTIFKKEAKYRFFNMIRTEEDEMLLQNKIIVLYELLNKLHNNNDETTFKKLKKIFFQIINKIRRTDCRIIYFMGLNFCVRLINSGKPEYFIELFEWYNIGLKNNLVLENNKMSDSTFNNIVNAACYKKEFIWAEKFIQDYYKCLDSNIQEDALNYAKATLSISQKDFLQALLLYTNHSYSIGNQLRVRAGIIRAAFEQTLIDPNYFSILMSYVDSFRKYLQRNTLFSEMKVIQNKNFIRITEKLAKKIWANERKKKIKTWLLGVLDKEKNIAMKSWLIEKANSL